MRTSLRIGTATRTNRRRLAPTRMSGRNGPDGGPVPTAALLQLLQGDLMKDEAERERGHQVDHEVAREIGHPVGSERQLESKLEEEHRADRQIRPGEELVLPDRKPSRRRSFEHDLSRDQCEENQDQARAPCFPGSRRTGGRKASASAGPAAFPAMPHAPGAKGVRPGGPGGAADRRRRLPLVRRRSPIRPPARRSNQVD